MNSELESSLKSIETENLIDRIFYRPIGFVIAKALKNTGITPNMVTVFSIFVGSASGIFFYFPYSISFALLGILFLILANILDCVDGQLARLTGIKSDIGRILDGFAGDFWFFLIYIAFIHRSNAYFNTWIFIPLAFLAAYNHINQAGLVDYYKTLHLIFVSKEKGKEFESSKVIKARVALMPKGLKKYFSIFYVLYTINQERQTPELQKMLERFKNKYGDNLPDDVRLSFRNESLKLMPILNILTFNGRTIVMFVSVLFNVVWVYLLWEIVVLALVKIIAQRKHEKLCKSFE